MTYEWLAPIKPVGDIFAEVRGTDYCVVQLDNWQAYGRPYAVLYRLPVSDSRGIAIQNAVETARAVRDLSRELTR